MVVRVQQQPKKQETTAHSSRPKPQSSVLGGPIQTNESLVLNQAKGTPVVPNAGRSTVKSLPDISQQNAPMQGGSYGKSAKQLYKEVQPRYAPVDTSLMGSEKPESTKKSTGKTRTQRLRETARRPMSRPGLPSVLGSQDTIG